MPSSPTIWPVCQPRRFRGCGYLRLCCAALRKERTVKRDVRDYTRGMGYALPRPVRRWLDGKVFGLREPLKLAIVRLANLVGRYHTGPKVGGRDFCLARQPKRKGRELDGGILTHPEMAGVSEHYFRLARQHLLQRGVLGDCPSVRPGLQVEARFASCAQRLALPRDPLQDWREICACSPLQSQAPPCSSSGPLFSFSSKQAGKSKAERYSPA